MNSTDKKADLELTADELRAKYDALAANDCWGQHGYFTREDWKYDVMEENTRLGYWDWVRHNIETASSEGEDNGEGSYLAYLEENDEVAA